MKEIWKDIEGYEGLYQVSNLGRVKSLDRLVKGRYGNSRLVKGKLLKSHLDRDGYLKVRVSINNNVINYFNHRLVAKTFIPNPDNKPQVNHINGIKTDNRIENLEWNTAKENSIHSVINGLSKTGVKHYKSKLTEKDVIEIRSSKLTNRALAGKYDVSHSTIGRIRTFKIWKVN